MHCTVAKHPAYQRVEGAGAQTEIILGGRCREQAYPTGRVGYPSHPFRICGTVEKPKEPSSLADGRSETG